MKTPAPQKIHRGAKQRLVVDRGTTIGGRRPWRHTVRLDQQALAARERTRRVRWLAISRANTVADTAPEARLLGQVSKGSFRQVDARGKAFGRRYTLVGHTYGWLGEVKVVDQHGEASLMAPGTRVRSVLPQEETLHSRFSRMLKAEFRRSP